MQTKRVTEARTPPPEHLTDRARAFWTEVEERFDLDVHERELLLRLCEAADRCDQARTEIATHGGVTYTTAKGDIRAHPAVAIERDARLAVVRITRELDLLGDVGPAPYDPRPPRRKP